MKIQWYFDFISPFAYFQCETLAQRGLSQQLECTPVLLAGLLGHWHSKGPAEIPAKRQFTYRHAVWLAQQQNIEFSMPSAHPFNPLAALRLAIALDSNFEMIRTIFRTIWGQGVRPDEARGLSTIGSALNRNDLEPLISAPEVKTKLLGNGKSAIDHGVFGVPTLLIDKELFWGYDSTDLALAYLEDPKILDQPEMKRASNLPVGAQRS